MEAREKLELIQLRREILREELHWKGNIRKEGRAENRFEMITAAARVLRSPVVLQRETMHQQSREVLQQQMQCVHRGSAGRQLSFGAAVPESTSRRPTRRG